MALHQNLRRLSKYRAALGEREWKSILLRAGKTQRQADEWKTKFELYLKDLQRSFVESLDRGVKPDFNRINFEPLMLEHAFETLVKTYEVAESEKELKGKIKKLAKPPSPRMPRSLKDLMKMWDMYRRNKRGNPSKRAEWLADRIKSSYIKKCESIWEKYGRDYIHGGNPLTKAEVIKKIYQTTKATTSRAKTIVETETTYYNNKARRTFYDKNDDITHYLYLAVRDHATTKWCKTRDGLVFEKDSLLLQNNTPPVHWNCRSEIVPLTGLNPNHLKLIEDKSIQAKNNTHRMAPLPVGWNRAA